MKSALKGSPAAIGAIIGGIGGDPLGPLGAPWGPYGAEMGRKSDPERAPGPETSPRTRVRKLNELIFLILDFS